MKYYPEMRGAVNLRVIAFVGVSVLCGGVASPAFAAEEGARAGEDRWVPSLAIVSGITFQEQSAGFISSDSMGNAIPNRCPAEVLLQAEGERRTPTAQECAVSDSEWAVTPYVGGNLQLLTATLPIPGRPRFFISGEILPSFGRDRRIALEGDPGPFISPDSPIYNDQAILGQGSATTATLDTWVFAASFGAAFPFEFRQRRLWVKPSVGWIRYKMDVEGSVRGVQCTQRPGIGSFTTQCLDLTDMAGNVTELAFQRDILLSGSDSQWYNGVGPGIELEMDVARFGPIGSSLFLDAHAYAILGNRSVSFSDSVSFPEQGPPGRELPAVDYTTRWDFEVDPWMFRAGGGIRFRWLGFEQ